MSDVPEVRLTPLEERAMSLTGELANVMHEIIESNGGDQVQHDWSEAARTIHVLQHMVMAQLASRAYPDMYRPLGGWPVERCSLHGEPIGPAPARNCPECRRQIEALAL